MYSGDNDDGDGNGENGDNGDDNGSGADDDGDNDDYRESWMWASSSLALVKRKPRAPTGILLEAKAWRITMMITNITTDHHVTQDRHDQWSSSSWLPVL